MVEVTQEDREAAASIAVLVEMRELIREGRADHHAEPFAHHRIAAENAALERAATAVHIEWFVGNRHRYASELGPACEAAIRAMKGPSKAEPSKPTQTN